MTQMAESSGGGGGGHRRSDNYLPPGFRFHPTDEELIAYYLLKKVLDSHFSSPVIAQVDLNQYEPWDLPEKAKMGEKEWYFFSLRDRKYPTGLRTNRATEAGYWKATGKDREILNSRTRSIVGMKKTLVFYSGRAPKGQKSNWVMHEFRLAGKFAYHFLSAASSKDEWVISRVFNKSGSGSGAGAALCGGAMKQSRLNTEPSSPSSASLPPLLDSSPYSAAAVFAERDGCSLDNSREHELHVTCFSTNNNFNFAGTGAGNARFPPGGCLDISTSAFPSLQPPSLAPVAPPPPPQLLSHLLAGGADFDGCGGGPALEESRLIGFGDMASMWTF